jgi:hypothetical protein
MRVGRQNRYVTLARKPQNTTEDASYSEPLTPATWWCQIQAAAPGSGTDLRSTAYLVTMRWHPQMTTDVQITYMDLALGRARYLLVMGVQNVNDRNDELRLLCEEVMP